MASAVFLYPGWLTLPEFGLKFLDRRQRAFEVFRQHLSEPVLRYADWFTGVPQGVFSNERVLRFAEQEADAGLVVGVTENVIDNGEVEVHLPCILRLEWSG